MTLIHRFRNPKQDDKTKSTFMYITVKLQNTKGGKKKDLKSTVHVTTGFFGVFFFFVTMVFEIG